MPWMPGPIPTCKEPRALRKEAVPCSADWDEDGVKKPRDQGSGGLEDARKPPGGWALPGAPPHPAEARLWGRALPLPPSGFRNPCWCSEKESEG